jgi:hypothetical protein
VRAVVSAGDDVQRQSWYAEQLAEELNMENDCNLRARDILDHLGYLGLALVPGSDASAAYLSELRRHREWK